MRTNGFILALTGLLFCQSGTVYSGELLDKLFEAAVQARHKYEESKKTIHKATEKTQEGWEASKNAARKTGDTIAKEYRSKKPSLQEAVRQTSQKTQQVSHRFRDLYKRHDFKGKKQYTQKKFSEWIELNKEAFTEAQQRTFSDIGPKILETAQNAEDAEKAFESISDALDIQSQIEVEVRSLTRKNIYFIVNAAMDMPIVTDDGTMSFKELNRRKLKKDLPYFSGTDISEDPAAIMTAVILHDKRYYLSELRIVKTKANVVPVNTIIRNPNDYTYQNLLKAIDLLNAVDQLQNAADTGRGGLDAVTTLVGSVKAANAMQENPKEQ